MNTRTCLMLSVLALALVASACGTADLRPDNFKSQLTQAQRQRGAELMDQMFQAHGGLDAWQRQEKVHARFKDDWPNWLFFQITPYEDNNAQASLEAYLHHFPHSRIEFLEGEAKGEVWMATGDDIHRLKDGHLKRHRVDEDAFFSVFVQNPEMMVGVMFRLASADQVTYVGTRQWQGKPYEVVMLSWGSFDPNQKIDQWLLYIHPETGRLEATEFTVRLSGASQVGFYHYRDFKEVQGMLLPHRMDAYLSKDDDDPVHTYRFEDMTFSQRGDRTASPSAAR